MAIDRSRVQSRSNPIDVTELPEKPLATLRCFVAEAPRVSDVQ